MEYAMLVWIHASMLSNNDSMTSSVINGFHSKESCMAAGATLKDISENTMKVTKFKCVEVK